MERSFKCLLAVLVAASHCIAEAEDLKPIGQVLPTRIQLYADRDSVSRSGELSKINFVLVVDPTSTDRLWMTFNCEKMTYKDPNGIHVDVSVPLRWKKGEQQYSMSNDALPNALAIACEPR